MLTFVLCVVPLVVNTTIGISEGNVRWVTAKTSSLLKVAQIMTNRSEGGAVLKNSLINASQNFSKELPQMADFSQ